MGGGADNPEGGRKRRRWEMATQVEALLPGNPLAKAAEEHGKLGVKPHEEPEGGRGEEGPERSGGSPGQGGTAGERTSEPGIDGGDSDKPAEEGGKGGGKEFTEAPPPKVNPWTKKMNAVTVVSVNGQAPTGLYPPPHIGCHFMSVGFGYTTSHVAFICSKSHREEAAAWLYLEPPLQSLW